MKIKLNWRLSKLPTVDELRELVKDKIITQEEAREILFSSQTEEDIDKNNLESEIKFLRLLVEQLSQKNSIRIVKVIKEIEKPWIRWDWYKPYQIWCGNNLNNSVSSPYIQSSISGIGTIDYSANGFSDIKTF